MDKYIYLTGGLVFVLLALIGCLVRKDLIPLAKRVGILAIPATLSELVFAHDYWRPPVVLGLTQLSLDDFVFILGVVITAGIAYPVCARKVYSGAKHPTYWRVYALFVVISLVALVAEAFDVGINSVVLISGLFVIFTAIMLYVRPDLAKASLLSGVGGVAFMAILYVIFFDVITPHWWDNYWLLAHTRLGAQVLGNVPVTELAWYFSWFMFASISFPFVEGREFATMPKTGAPKLEIHTPDWRDILHK